MSDWDSLESLLNYLEEHAIEYVGLSDLQKISSLFSRLYDCKKEEEQEEAQKVLWERWVFRLVLKGGYLENWCLHFTEGFDEGVYTYLRERLSVARNPILAAQYAHTLWHGPNRDITYARRAIDSYREITNSCESEDRKLPHAQCGFYAIRAIHNAYGLGAMTGYRLSDTKAEVIRLIKDFSFDSRWSIRLRQDLILVVLKDSKHFEKAELSGIQDVCWHVFASCMKSNVGIQIHEAKDMIDLGRQIDRRLGLASHNWDLERAKCYEKLMRMRRPGDCAIPSFCLDAIQNYRKAGSEDKARALEAEYGGLASSVRLACFTVEVDMTDTISDARALSEKVASLHPGQVVDFLASQTDVLPRCNDIKRALSQGAVDPFLMDAPSATIDDVGHLTERCATPDEREKREMLRVFGQQLAMRYLPILREVILKAIAADKLSSDTLREHLRQRSWLGKNLHAQSPTKGSYSYRWYDLLEPSLIGYIEKTKQWLTDGTRTPNLIAEIDSLTMKFEGMLRDLLRHAGTVTFQQKRQDYGLTEERFIGKLLYLDDAKRIFIEDDLLFLRFLLTEDSGYDLRNRVAHCLLLAEDYSLNYMHLLFMAVLRLSKYDLPQQADGQTQI